MFCIVVTDTSTQALLIKLQGPHTNILSKSKRYHYLDANSLVIKTDEALQELGPDSEKVNTVVFALEKSWLDDGVVQPKKQQVLDSLVKDLSLKPVGFVEQIEALSHAVATQSSGSTILLLLSQTAITATVVQHNTIFGEQNIGKSGDIVADVTEALARLHKQVGTLPAKVLCVSALLSDEELEMVQQDLLTADWLAGNFFLQQPSIEFMAEEQVLSFLAVQAGIAAHLATQTARSEPAKTAVEGDNFLPVEFAVEPEDATAKSFGIPIPTKVEETNPDFGFSEEAPNEDVVAKPYHKPHKFIGIGVIFGVLALATAAFIGMYFFSSVTINITPVSKTVSREIELGLDASIAVSDPEALTIKAQQYEAEFTSTQTTEASGVALVGEKARGNLTIFNKTDEEKTFPIGTVFTAQELVFTLDEEVTIPAATVTTKTGGGGEVKDYGTKSSTVTATAIGAEGNLAKGIEFTVESFASSSYSATSDEAFTGGASREVRVVSATDLELLVSDAKKDILQQAEKQFAEKSGSGLYLLPPQQLVVKSTSDSAKEGTEADSASITLVATVKTLSYKTEDLLPIVTAVLQTEVPEGFVLKDREPEVLSAPNEARDLSQKITLSVNISAQVVADVSLDDLRSKILGDSFEAARNTLLGNTKVQAVDIQMQPAVLNGIWKHIPKQEDRVQMQVVGSERG